MQFLLYHIIIKYNKDIGFYLGEGSYLPKPYGSFNDNSRVINVASEIMMSAVAEMTLNIKSLSFFILSPPLAYNLLYHTRTIM